MLTNVVDQTISLNHSNPSRPFPLFSSFCSEALVKEIEMEPSTQTVLRCPRCNKPFDQRKLPLPSPPAFSKSQHLRPTTPAENFDYGSRTEQSWIYCIYIWSKDPWPISPTWKVAIAAKPSLYLCKVMVAFSNVKYYSLDHSSRC